MTRHTIEAVNWTSDIDGDVDCSCGAQLRASDYRDHQKAAGKGKASGNALGPRGPAPEHIVASRLRGTRNSR